jgi:hypothetical protein
MVGRHGRKGVENNIWLVVEKPTLKNDGVSWDDEIPN